MRSLHRFIPLLDMALLGQRTSNYDTAAEVLARPQTLNPGKRGIVEVESRGKRAGDLSGKATYQESQ